VRAPPSRPRRPRGESSASSLGRRQLRARARARARAGPSPARASARERGERAARARSRRREDGNARRRRGGRHLRRSPCRRLASALGGAAACLGFGETTRRGLSRPLAWIQIGSRFASSLHQTDSSYTYENERVLRRKLLVSSRSGKLVFRLESRRAAADFRFASGRPRAFPRAPPTRAAAHVGNFPTRAKPLEMGKSKKDVGLAQVRRARDRSTPRSESRILRSSAPPPSNE